MKPAQHAEYIVQCIREAGSMYEDDAREFLVQHDAYARAEVLAEVSAWLIKKAREFPTRNKQGRTQADTAAILASKISRGAVRPNNLRMLPDPHFFEVDHTYQCRGDEFRVLAIDPHPVRGDLTAVGWLIEDDGKCLIFRMTSRDWQSGKWTDVTEEAAS